MVWFLEKSPWWKGKTRWWPTFPKHSLLVCVILVFLRGLRVPWFSLRFPVRSAMRDFMLSATEPYIVRFPTGFQWISFYVPRAYVVGSPKRLLARYTMPSLCICAYVPPMRVKSAPSRSPCFPLYATPCVFPWVPFFVLPTMFPDTRCGFPRTLSSSVTPYVPCAFSCAYFLFVSRAFLIRSPSRYPLRYPWLSSDGFPAGSLQSSPYVRTGFPHLFTRSLNGAFPSVFPWESPKCPFAYPFFPTRRSPCVPPTPCVPHPFAFPYTSQVSSLLRPPVHLLWDRSPFTFARPLHLAFLSRTTFDNRDCRLLNNRRHLCIKCNVELS